MALALIPMEPNTTFLAMNYMPHPPLSFAFYWTGNRIKTICTKLSNQSSRRRQSKAFDRSINKAQKHHIYLHFHAIFSIIVIKQCCNL